MPGYWLMALVCWHTQQLLCSPAEGCGCWKLEAGGWKQLQASFVVYWLLDAYAQGSWRFFVHRCYEPSDVGTLSCVFCLVLFPILELWNFSFALGLLLNKYVEAVL
ncbi:hypothetical protein Nepgr_009345 [Nepenthes gracilis]|uniref:Uncharacterized protein n=1 Tax=Nepenthes gracilis TaxID=150966 RepID=A0AAD3SAF5_NEPGR|nr:hypothetical protein Nepgr_009345 [Nepenthes gracilis]